MWCPTSKENYPLNTSRIRIFVHLLVILHFRLLRCSGEKIDGVQLIPCVPINVRCSIFNEIPPIRDWWGFHLNDCHWLIRTQAWAISMKEWDLAFFQWGIACCVCEKVWIDKCWFSLHSRNTLFDGGGTIWRCKIINPDTSKGRLIWIKGYFRWDFIIVGVEQIVHFPQHLQKEKKESAE